MHFACSGDCGGSSDSQINCGTEGCSMEGKPMKACDCTDGRHEDVKGEQKKVDG